MREAAIAKLEQDRYTGIIYFYNPLLMPLVPRCYEYMQEIHKRALQGIYVKFQRQGKIARTQNLQAGRLVRRYDEVISAMNDDLHEELQTAFTEAEILEEEAGRMAAKYRQDKLRGNIQWVQKLPSQ